MVMDTFASTLLAAAMLICADTSRACGQCDEDKMAATYDHEVTQLAAKQRRTVVYCEVRGPLDMAAVRTAARAVAGIDPDTLRLSSEPSALSFVVDPQVQRAGLAVAELQRSLGSKVSLRVLNRVPLH
jgi:hypothetical protein